MRGAVVMGPRGRRAAGPARRKAVSRSSSRASATTTVPGTSGPGAPGAPRRRPRRSGARGPRLHRSRRRHRRRGGSCRQHGVHPARRGLVAPDRAADRRHRIRAPTPSGAWATCGSVPAASASPAAVRLENASTESIVRTCAAESTGGSKACRRSRPDDGTAARSWLHETEAAPDDTGSIAVRKR